MSPAAPLMSNYPTFLSTNRASKQGTAQRGASCRKLGAKTRRFTVRGRSRTQTMRFRTFHSDIAQQNPRSQVSYCVGGRRSPVSTCPVPSIRAFSDRKNDNMPPRGQIASPKNPVAPPCHNTLPKTPPHQNTLSKLCHAARLQRTPRSPDHTASAQKIRGADRTSDSNARLLAKTQQHQAIIAAALVSPKSRQKRTWANCYENAPLAKPATPAALQRRDRG